MSTLRTEVGAKQSQHWSGILTDAHGGWGRGGF